MWKKIWPLKLKFSIERQVNTVKKIFKIIETNTKILTKKEKKQNMMDQSKIAKIILIEQKGDGNSQKTEKCDHFDQRRHHLWFAF